MTGIPLSSIIKGLFESRLNLGNSRHAFCMYMYMLFHRFMCQLHSGSVVECQPCMRDVVGLIPGGGGLDFPLLFSFSRFSVSICKNAFEKKGHYNY